MSAGSAGRLARTRLDRARQTSWSDAAKAEAAWADVAAAEPRLLAPADHIGDLVEKLRYLLALSEDARERTRAVAQRPWKSRLLHSAFKDAVRLSAEVEQHSRREQLRRYMAGLGNKSGIARQLDQARRELQETRAERDAAYAALERANGLAQRSAR